MNYLSCRGIFLNLERAIAISIAGDALDFRIFRRVRKRNGYLCSFSILIIRHGYIESNLMIWKSRFVIKHGAISNRNPTSIVNVEQRIGTRRRTGGCIEQRVVERTVCGMSNIRIRSHDLTHQRTGSRIFGNREFSVVSSRLFVNILYIDGRDCGIGKATRSTVAVREDKANFVTYRIGTTCKQRFVVELCTVLNSNHDLQGTILCSSNRSFKKLFGHRIRSVLAFNPCTQGALAIASIRVRNLDSRRSNRPAICRMFRNDILIQDVINMRRFVQVIDVDDDFSMLRERAVGNGHIDFPDRSRFIVKSIVRRNPDGSIRTNGKRYVVRRVRIFILVNGVSQCTI